jgi:hypothetical protein
MAIKYSYTVFKEGRKVKLTKATNTTIVGSTRIDFTPTTLDPDNKGTSIALSNGNLTMTETVTADRLARSIASHSSGKRYFEMTIGAGNYCAAGVMLDGGSLNGYVGYDAYSWSYYGTGNSYHNAAPTAFGATTTAADVIGVAMDIDNGFIYFSKNGTWQNSGDPTSGASGTGAAYGSVTGTLFAAVSVYGDTDNVTCNFGASGFVYSVPSGYSSGW